jgi:NADH-quinone oxidoreductase subunit C
MATHLDTAIAALKHRLDVLEEAGRTGLSLIVSPDRVFEAVKILRDEFEFNFLSSLTASDYWPQLEPRFHLVYQFYSHNQNVRLCIRVPLDGSEPVAPSVEPLFPNANWHERELWDMFGIRFEGNSDMRRILMPYDWVGHPLRKDYPLGYEEPQFTFNFQDIQVRKHRARYEEA